MHTCSFRINGTPRIKPTLKRVYTSPKKTHSHRGPRKIRGFRHPNKCEARARDTTFIAAIRTRARISCCAARPGRARYFARDFAPRAASENSSALSLIRRCAAALHTTLLARAHNRQCAARSLDFNAAPRALWGPAIALGALANPWRSCRAPLLLAGSAANYDACSRGTRTQPREH